jgi:hypothetical protein
MNKKGWGKQKRRLALLPMGKKLKRKNSDCIAVNTEQFSQPNAAFLCRIVSVDNIKA